MDDNATELIEAERNLGIINHVWVHTAFKIKKIN